MNSSIFICYPHALLTGLSLPMEMIAAANSIARIQKLTSNRWHCHVVSSVLGDIKAIEMAKGLKILPSYHLGNTPEASTIFLPPIWGNPEAIINRSAALLDWLSIQYSKGVEICATGTGVCLLAHLGLLDDKAATTHWYYFDQFEKHYPNVNLQRHHFITQAGSLFCCGSINALADLSLYFIERQFGKLVSQIIEQHFNHEINRTYDKPWYFTGATRHPDESILEVQQWMESHYAQIFNVRALAELANMSVRNFSRRFKSAVGKSVLGYGIDIKMKVARDLLKNSNLSQQDIADQVGFKDVTYFNRQFKIRNDLTPGAYREMVRGKLFNLNSG